MLPFIGLAVSLTFENLEKECDVIGLKRIHGKHNAEIIKTLIEEIINDYQFDKSNIHGVVSDQGSNLRRLFKEAEDAKEKTISKLTDEDDGSDEESGEDTDGDSEYCSNDE